MAVRHRPFWHWVIIIVLALCGFGIAVYLVKRPASWLRGGPAVGDVTPVPTLSATAVHSVANVPPDTSTPEWTPDATQPAESSESATRTPAVTPSPTKSPDRQAMNTPTPIVCTDLAALGYIPIAQGQRFRCTAYQDQLNEQLRDVQDLPCSDISIALDDEQFTFTCQVGIEIKGSGVVQVNNCQVDIQITEGTIGFAEALQLLVDNLLPKLPYEELCFDQVAIDDGQMELAGYGR